MLGYTAADVMSAITPAAISVSPELIARAAELATPITPSFEAGIKRVLSEKSVTDYELTASARDGKQTVVSSNVTPFFDR